MVVQSKFFKNIHMTIKTEFFVVTSVLVGICSFGVLQDVQATSKRKIKDETVFARPTADLEVKYNSGSANKTRNRLGVGAAFGGGVGALGLQLNINVIDTWTYSLGYGWSSFFDGFNTSIKKSVSTSGISPYVGAGFSHWSGDGTNGSVDETFPTVLGRRILSEKEKREGIFSKNLIYPSLGLEYFNPSGDWAGYSFAIELDYLIDIQNFESGATAGISIARYF